MRSIAWCVAAVVVAGAAYGVDLVSTRTTGQYRVEATPVAVDVNGDGASEWVLLGEQGQVMAWNADLSNFGAGQDGAVATLPTGKWPSSPAAVRTGTALRLVFVSDDGNVAALDETFAPAWTYQLPGKTTWSRATPLVLAGDEPLLVIGDHSGTLTALHGDGSVVWSKDMGLGPCKTLLQSVPDAPDQFLAPLGNHLACIDRAGDVVWKTDVGEPVSARAEVFDLPEGRRVLCGTAQGTLVALDAQGALRWKSAVGDELDCSITLVPRNDDAPLVVVAGLWGNLHAFDMQGQHVWTHLFRAKNRARPVLLDCDGDGQDEVVVAAYGQRAYVVNAQGRRVDEFRLSGTVNAWPLLIPNANALPPDMVFISGVLLAHRFRVGPPTPIYGSVGEYGNVSAERNPSDGPDGPGILVRNPRHAFVRANVIAAASDNSKTVAAALSARDWMVIPSPAIAHDAALTVELSDPAGGPPTVVTLAAEADPGFDEATALVRVWPAPAYASFDSTRVTQHVSERDYGQDGIFVDLNRGEVDQGAFVVASRAEEPLTARVEIEMPKREDGAVFGGAFTLREVVLTPTVNGEIVADALPDLGDGTILKIPSNRAVKVWISVDGNRADPGIYAGHVRITPIAQPELISAIPITVVVDAIALPAEFPLTFCTWDYLPNTWFPEHTPENLDDMGRHGVNVFPRSTLPTATYANDAIQYDWTLLDAELDRLEGRGEILFHIGEPAIAGAESLDATARHALHIQYLHAFRDHLHARGLDYDDYAFYPVDEPGLDYGPRVPVYIAAAELFREADPKFRAYTDPVPGLSMQDYQRIAPLVDVWCPNMRLVNGLLSKDPRMEDIMASGKPVWSYECISQVKSLSPLRYNRANAWRAYYFGLDGIGHWTYSTTQANHWFANADKNDEYALVYPGDRPVPSVRWEAVRDGLEDIAALTMLQAEIDRNKAAGTKAELVAEAEAFLKGAMIDVMELSDQVYIESRDYLKQGDRRLWHTWWDALTFDEIRRKVGELTAQLVGES